MSQLRILIPVNLDHSDLDPPVNASELKLQGRKINQEIEQETLFFNLTNLEKSIILSKKITPKGCNIMGSFFTLKSLLFFGSNKKGVSCSFESSLYRILSYFQYYIWIDFMLRLKRVTYGYCGTLEIN